MKFSKKKVYLTFDLFYSHLDLGGRNL